MWKRNCFKLLCLILSLSFLTALPSCSKKKEAGSVTEPASFTDSMGRSITLEEKPKRVAALLGSFADLWVLAGGELCAVADDAEDFGLNTDGLIQLGGAHSPSLEQLFSADPDFVLASASTAAHVNMLDSLESAADSLIEQAVALIKEAKKQQMK